MKRLKSADLESIAMLLDEAAKGLQVTMDTEEALENQTRHYLPDELRGSAIMLRDEIKAAEAVAPWKDHRGRPIVPGDLIEHPHSREIGEVLYLPEEANEVDRWRVRYGNGNFSRLSLQVNSKGQAVVIGRRTEL